MGNSVSSSSFSSVAVAAPSKPDPPKGEEPPEVEKQLQQLKQEILPLQPVITEGVKSRSSEDQDALVIKYSDLADKTKIVENIEKLFPDHPAKDFIVDTATAMIHAMASTKEMEELMRWQKRQVIKTVGDKIYGMELQYKVRLLDSSIRRGFDVRKTKETTLMIAYKSIVHVMEGDPRDHPTHDELKKLKF